MDRGGCSLAKGWRGGLAGPCREPESKRDGRGLSSTTVFLADDRVTGSGAERGGPGPEHAAAPRQRAIVYRNPRGERRTPSPAQQQAGLPRAQHPRCPNPKGKATRGAQPAAGRGRTTAAATMRGAARWRGRAGGGRAAGPGRASPEAPALPPKPPEPPLLPTTRPRNTHTYSPPTTRTTAAASQPLAPPRWGSPLGHPPRPAGLGTPGCAHRTTRLGLRSCW